MIKNEDFILIPGFTINLLNLSGNEQKLYSLIWGFSKDGNSKFTGSVSYMMEWLNCSRRSVFYTLNSLVEKGLIEKEEKFENGVKFVSYVAITPQMKNLHGWCKNCTGVVQKLHGGGAKIAPNNISNNISNNINNNIYKETISSKDIVKKGCEDLGKKECQSLYMNKKNSDKNYNELSEVSTQVVRKSIIPSQQDVIDYCTANGLIVDPYYFFSYYSNNNWKDAYGKPVKNWKNRINTWNAKELAKRYSKLHLDNQKEINAFDEKLEKALKEYPYCHSLEDFHVTEQYGEIYLMPKFTEDGIALDKRGFQINE